MRFLKPNFCKSVLFFNPDYHCSFFLRDELRKRGWRAEISVSSSYPDQVLWSNDVKRNSDISWRVQFIRRWASIARYHYVVHYGAIGFGLGKRSKVIDFGIVLWVNFLRLFGFHLVYLPSGCNDYMTKADWMKVDSGNVCGSCGFEPRCDDKKNQANFTLVRKVASTSLMGDGHRTTEFPESRIRYKSFDLEVFSPSMQIPNNHLWLKSSSIRVLHSTALEGRSVVSRNIKGSEFVVSAVESLARSGLDVELIQISGVPSREMRFHQVQADIVVDQLIYGGYGSTALECLALGKPVVCYIRESWKQFLTSHFPEWDWCPIISATPLTVEAELRKLVENDELRTQIGIESRRFAEQFLDVKKNVLEFEHLLLNLK